jgi:GNAT superfamily N-acetyltransferase
MTLTFSIFPAQPADSGAIFNLIKELAAYEHLQEEMIGSQAALQQHLFGRNPVAEALVVKIPEQAEAAGFALFFRTYSTFLTQPGLYLEDLYIQPQYRGNGMGKALLIHLAKIAVERGYGRLEWAVLDWNTPAIEFYQRMGARLLREWIPNRVTGQALLRLAEGYPMKLTEMDGD